MRILALFGQRELRPANGSQVSVPGVMRDGAWVMSSCSALLILACNGGNSVERSSIVVATNAPAVEPTPIAINDPYDPQDVLLFLINKGELDRGHSLLSDAEHPHINANEIMARVPEPTVAVNASVEEGTDTLVNGSWVPTDLTINYQHDGTCLPQLSKIEAKELIAQLDRGWQWNGNALGFNQGNDSSYYSISRPMVTRNGALIQLTVEDLCRPFLCGRGWNLVLLRDSSGWQVQRCGGWIH